MQPYYKHKPIVVLVIALFWSCHLFAQQDRVAPITSLKTGLVGASVGHEFPLSKYSVLNAEFGLLNGSIQYSSGNDYPSTWSLSLPIGLELEPRIYYNLAKRIRKSKMVTLNSANFVSIAALYSSKAYLGNLSQDPFIALVPQWGIRRNLGKKFYFESSVGIGVSYASTSFFGMKWSRQETLNIKFGYALK